MAKRNAGWGKILKQMYVPMVCLCLRAVSVIIECDVIECGIIESLLYEKTWQPATGIESCLLAKLQPALSHWDTHILLTL